MEFLSRALRWVTSRDLALDMMEPDPLHSPRERTVKELARMLDENRVIHVRGTPASGKTILARLLSHHYRQQKIAVIAFHSWRTTPPQYYQDKIIDEARRRGYRQFDAQFVEDGNYVLILDEGQMTYRDEALWIELIKNQSGSHFGPRICIFTCYGSPTEGPDSEYSAGSLLAYLGPQQRVSITPSSIQFSPWDALFYNLEEFEDVVERFCHRENQNPQLKLDETAREYIFNLTHGHPGAVDGILHMLLQVYHSELKHEEITLNDSHVISSLDNEAQAFAYLLSAPVCRSFPRPKRISPEAAEILRKALSEGNVDRDLNNEGIKQCYENGWLHSEPADAYAERIVCVFPTRLHAKFVEHYWTSSTMDFPLERYPNITALAQAVLARFSPRNISSGIRRFGDAATIRPWEVAYQDEFYRAAHEVLGYAMNVTSEWSSGGQGCIDFRFAQVGWGIELLREGDRLKEHCERFASTGTYARWIADGSIKDWLIIDCRTTRPEPYGIPDPKVWRAVFAADFSSVEILDWSNKALSPQIPLMSS
ncbi:hypothetical protein BDV23DRAFT_182776 [Aspergillus alliaceus]|uniref:Novel STAND NTPase 3 domain-containing protein n=1 Tax=Petromyces alliaceus TaxID=209559 RepID=A0A5N7CAU2_PETAA|nr:hypothetical protein BDV23DRAFT_182776 [Aspergillus alliaceus]